MIDLKNSIENYYPDLGNTLNRFKFAYKFLDKFLRIDQINSFIAKNKHLKNFAFLDAILDEYDFDYKISSKHRYRIPAEGRLVIVANHPIGSLDGLALLRMIYDIRPDVKIVATPLLTSIEQMQDLFLPIDNFRKKAQHKDNLTRIYRSLEAEQAVIIFPAGEVSRITPKGVRDGRWKTGFLKIAKACQAPILPVYINAHNSALFYSASTIYKPLGTMLLINEMYKQKNDTIEFFVGHPVEVSGWHEMPLKRKKIANRFRKHLLKIRKGKSLFPTTPAIAHPIQTKRLRAEIKKLEKMGQTRDGMSIYLLNYTADSLLMREIGRVRELAFRTVNEGTGQRIDLDIFDTRYKHLLLWNEKEMEIVGAYRIGVCREIIKEHGIEGLYCSTLYNFDASMLQIADQTLELGRSFVHPKYWGLKGLDYLWSGLGAYIANNPNIKYLYGPVSLSGDYPLEARDMIVNHYETLYPKPQSAPQASGKHPYHISGQTTQVIPTQKKTAFKQLNKSLEHYGVKVPTLFKQYTDLCHDGGVGFITFSVDPDFNDCIDGLIWVEVDQMTEKKYNRYIAGFNTVEQLAVS
ncbi:GNAT family N-acyltransferase [Marinicella sp. W31]|uniref:GNAT family N-acyltransferase n=1 Tax=Marinicella sp. W31 TaxID=3023713 RepID=UPI003756DDED